MGKAQGPTQYAALDPTGSIRVGRNIPINSQFKGLPLVEPSLAAHPHRANHLLAAAMVVTDVNRPYESCRLSSFLSEDGGETWQETAHDYWGYDPWVTILPSGAAAMSWLGTPGAFTHRFPLQVFSSADGGKAWEPGKAQVFNGHGHGHDGTKLAGLGDKMYLTTVRFNADMGADVVLYGATGQGPFTELAAIPGGGRRLNFCEPALLSDGTVVLPTVHPGGSIRAHIYRPGSGLDSESGIISRNPKLGRGYSRMAADTGRQSPFRDRLYFVRAVAEGRGSLGVWLNYSTDRGNSWSEEKRIDLFEGHPASKANVASVAVNNRGIVGISWVDGQHSEDQRAYDVYFSISRDGGASFQRPVRVTDRSSDPRTPGNADVANKFIGGGHYLGISARQDGSFQLLWSDSRSGIFGLQTCRIQVE